MGFADALDVWQLIEESRNPKEAHSAFEVLGHLEEVVLVLLSDDDQESLSWSTRVSEKVWGLVTWVVFTLRDERDIVEGFEAGR